ncbi:nuclear transport factor 2 family protein [Aurantiacibacter zhengii]|uniref:Nuclear transport factor 2 family protein n=2 Tax=Aurantiacibacter zhengii TaxID=2307003 RepID=A0A418NVN2_9SPHN|nr:nuclear transport factor 2 family protein [Aurantiacibacter zhengii]
MAALAMAVPANAQEEDRVSQLAQQVAQLQAQSQAARDRQAVENLFSRYMYLHNAFEDEQIIPLWAAEGTPGMSAQYSNLGKYTQYDKIMEYHRGRPSPIGKLLFHYVTTPVIEVAGDGQTAKGLWIVNGLESGLTAPEHAANMPDWMFEPNVEVDGKKVWMHNVYLKYGIDFIKQDGEWKIWHFHCFETARAPYSMGWIPFAAAAQDDSFNFDLMYVGDDGAPVFMPETDEPATVLNNSYRTDTAQHLEARIPEPYYTFSETFSY